MTADRSVFIDTNVLVYASTQESHHYAEAKNLIFNLLNNGAAVWISNQIIRKFLCSQTRTIPGAKLFPLSSALQQVSAFQQWFRIADETADVRRDLLNILQEVPAGGKQIHDANIVATMQTYGIPTLLTYNRSDFERYARFITLLDQPEV